MKEVDETIEKIADFLSVSFSSKRIISSCRPFIAFEAEDDKENNWLEDKSGIEINLSEGNQVNFSQEINLFNHLNDLEDREDGIKILSEVLNCDHKSGKYRDLIRFYERAFGCSGKRLTQPLYNFLKGNIFGYTKDEIENWIKFRDPITHADRRKEITFEKDVISIIDRMLQAAKFILLNKKEWNKASAIKRNLWQPKFGSSEPDNGKFVVQGNNAIANISLMDKFNSFHLDIRARLRFDSDRYWYEKKYGKEA